MRTFVSAVVAVAIALFVAVPAFAAHDVTITARNFTFSPAVVRLKKGEPVVFHLRAAQGVHGLNVPEVGLPHELLTSREKTVRATPHQAGTFVVHCAVVCGTGHSHMGMTFIVK